MSDGVMTTSGTGGMKGVKSARFDLVPARAEWLVAELFGKGAEKYADRNWERGYEWSKSYGALRRHLNLWWQGEDLDSGEGGTGLPHLASVAWHALALLTFAETHPQFDDRPSTLQRREVQEQFMEQFRTRHESPIWMKGVG